jgi:hypothetical protein
LKIVNLNSVAEPKPHHFGGAGAVTRCGSGSGSDAPAPSPMFDMHGRFIKIALIFMLIYVCFNKVSLVYSRERAGAGEVGTAAKFCLEPQQNDVAPNLMKKKKC